MFELKKNNESYNPLRSIAMNSIQTFNQSFQPLAAIHSFIYWIDSFRKWSVAEGIDEINIIITVQQ